MKFYPLQFKTIAKDRIWGGTKLKTCLNKEIPTQTTGESWEISTVPSDISIAANGGLAGKNLNEIITLYSEEILGNRVLETFGKQFPLLFKFIDAREDLSIQLHPNDELAKKRHNSFGKTEMWYVMQSDEQARLVVGFKENSNQSEYLKALENKQLISVLNEIPVKKGDVFFLETGTIHAIGKGVLVAEIQQTSDITYRLYDWDRTDADGNERELHTEQALEAINYNKTQSQVFYRPETNNAVKLVHCPYFNTDILSLNGTVNWEAHNGSFTVLMCTEGSFSIEINGETYHYTIGNTVLLPAVIKNAEIRGNAVVLEVYL